MWVKIKQVHRNTVNICLLTNSSGYSGGAEKTLPILAKELIKNGFNVLVIIPSYGDLAIQLDKFNISYKIIPYKMWMNKSRHYWKKLLISIFNIIALFPLIFVLYKHKINFVISNTITISIGAFAAKITNIPHLWYIKEFGYEDHSLIFDLGYKISYFLMNKCNSFYLFNSYAVMNKYYNILNGKNKFVIYEGYLTDNDILNLNDNNNSLISNIAKINCLMIGMLQQGKGHVDAINAMHILKSKGYEVQLDIIGKCFDKNYLNYLNNLISKNNLNENIKFHGFLEKPFETFRKSYIFLMCSRNEAYGLVTIEAMQYGMAVIASKSGGTIELIKENVNGVFYSPGNHIDLADKIEYLIKNPELVNELRVNAKKYVFDNFTLKNYIINIIDIIKNIKKIDE